MNCRRIEELIPLYAGGDLDRKLTDGVQTHLKTCSACAGLAAEFKATGNWLREASPELEEAALAEMKRGVMKELQGVRPRLGWFSLMEDSIPRMLLQPIVAAGLLLIVFGALTFWLYFGRKNSTPPIQAKAPELTFPERGPAGGPTEDEPRRVVNKDPRGYEDHRRRVRVSKYPRQRQSDAASRLAITRLPDSIDEAPSALLNTDESDQMLRIEIETGDPTIRIIWFAQKQGDSQQANP